MKIIIIGGGPAGATLGNYLLQETGFDVTIIEKEAFPRHHVGESLQPDVIRSLTEIGIPLSELSIFPRKYGALYKWGVHNDTWSVLYSQQLDELYEQGKACGDISQYEHGFNVDRARFDKILLDHFQEKGGKLLIDPVKKIHFRDTCEAGAIDSVELESGANITADIYIDASGQRSLISEAKKLKVVDSFLKNTAIYTYYKGYKGLNTLLDKDFQYIESQGDNWFWWIPISYDIVSVGMIFNSAQKKTREDYEEKLRESEIYASVKDAQRVDNTGNPTDGFYYASDWSFISKRAYGENWFLLGDAFGFVDPILSGGVSFSMEKALHLGKVLALMSKKPDRKEILQKVYEAKYREDVSKYLQMAYVWYSKTHAKNDWIELSGDKRKFVEYISGGQRFLEQNKIFQDWQNKKIYDNILKD